MNGRRAGERAIAPKAPRARGASAARLGAAGLAFALAAACQDDAVRPTVSMTAADTADQVLVGMEHFITADGVRRTRVLADTAYLYEPTQLARLKHVTVTFYDANGSQTSTVTADSGLYQMRDGSMQAWSKVVARTPNGRVLRSEELRYDARRQEIASDKPFIYDRGDQHLEGNGFTSDPEFRNVVTRQPRGGQQGGGQPAGVVLPGQD